MKCDKNSFPIKIELKVSIMFGCLIGSGAFLCNEWFLLLILKLWKGNCEFKERDKEGLVLKI